jgi:hypothetical protein
VNAEKSRPTVSVCVVRVEGQPDRVHYTVTTTPDIATPDSTRHVYLHADAALAAIAAFLAAVHPG